MKSLHSENICFYICYSFLLFGQQWSEKNERLLIKKFVFTWACSPTFSLYFFIIQNNKDRQKFHIDKIKNVDLI